MTAFTAVFGGYDEFRAAPPGGVLFTDIAPPEGLGWDARVVTPPYPDNLARSNRYYKLQPHEHFPDGARVLYFDASMTLKHSPEAILARFQEAAGGDHDVFTLAHPRGHTLASEHALVTSLRLANRETLRAQRERYESLGVPLDRPNPEARLIITRINDRTRAFYDAWWREVKTYTHRDQISFPYARWLTDADVHLIPFRAARPLYGIYRHAKPRLQEDP